ncbi:MAG: dual specificity protein phosphatase family protein [Thermoplasmata archaeon]|nr:dual specificity protein phosphatase family protein [Thermoplasmata archaeon]
MGANPHRPRSTRKASAATASEFAPGLFVGGWKDAEKFSGTRFCVLDEAPEGMPDGVHVAIYDGEKDTPILENLERVAGLMHAAARKNERVLVYCGHGVRRSPLAAAWYLHRFAALPLDEAYAKIRGVRPQVEEAKEWMEHWQVLETATTARAGRSAR